MKPIIVIAAQQTTSEEENDLSSSCRQVYIDSIVEAGGIPLILPLKLDHADNKLALACARGVLLVGGCDVNPALYNQTPHEKLGETNPRRDALDLWLARHCHQTNIPTLGICRGLQVMNVALGGTLYQDLPNQFPSRTTHRSSGADSWSKKAHSVTISSGSLLAEILNTTSIAVNSLHHQGIKDLAPELQASAVADDTLIEAIEDSKHPFYLAVQWHPEVLWQHEGQVWLELFRSFVNACKQTW